MKLLIKTLLLTSLMLMGYFLLVKSLKFETRFAESNYVANQIRMQAMETEKQELGIVTAGSSLTARLKTASIKSDKKCLNLGLDGSSAIFAVNKLLDAEKIPEVLIIELNTIYRDTSKGDQLLRESSESGTNKLAEYFPLVRARNRPVTMMYSKLKSWKDGRSGIDLKLSAYTHVKPQKVYESLQSDAKYIPNPALEEVVKRAQKKNIRVVLLIMPEGKERTFEHGALLTELMKNFDIELLDLMTPLAKDLTYSDGLHLAEPSAEFATQLIVNALKN